MTEALAGPVKGTSRAAGTGGKGLYIAHFAAAAARLPGFRLPWLGALRRQAIERFAELDFPTVRHEDWKYTSVAPLTRIQFAAAGEEGPGRLPPGFVTPFGAAGFVQLVFVDGRLEPRFSKTAAPRAGVRIESLRTALESRPEEIEEHLGRYADREHQAFTALNTALWSDGVYVSLPATVHAPAPIHVLFVTTAAAEPRSFHHRNLIVARAGSAATVIEHYVGAGAIGGIPSFTNSVTEIAAEQGAKVTHLRLQEEREDAFHIGMVEASQGRDSLFRSHSFATGARLARSEIRTLLDGEGAECALNGLYLARGHQHSDHQTLIDHARPHCTSNEIYKGILDGSSRGVFTGRIIVREDAQKTNANQTNRNLILSDTALVDARPQLEIRANDVKCTHGAAIGQLDDDMIFYLRSRGIGETEARGLLTQAFASEVLSRIGMPGIEKTLERTLADWFAGNRGANGGPPAAGAGRSQG